MGTTTNDIEKECKDGRHLDEFRGNDMQHDFCDTDAPTTLWPSIAASVEPIQQLCTEARARHLPVFYTRGWWRVMGRRLGLWRSAR
jgi:hypothetical protein